MTDKEELESNIACAKLLNYNIVDAYTGNVYVQRKSDKRFSGTFNIFTNASQCLEVVKKLGECGISICIAVSRNKWCVTNSAGVMTDSRNRTMVAIEEYEEAVAAAAMEVMK